MATLFYLNQYVSKTLSVGGGIDASQTTGITLNNTTGLDITKPGICAFSWADPLDEDTVEWITYTSINGSNVLQGVVRGAEGGTGRTHLNGAIVAFPISESHINNLADAVKAEHSDDGVHSAISKTAYSTFNAPEGFLINGKIVPSVASNDLTVAIKGMDGNDPSATNPVYCRIGSVVRSITGALSVTKADATNWFNAGGAELATKEVDYFVYLGYNATDGVVVGFSRIPYATLYSDFSATSTNEKYAGISTITNAAAGDGYVNIGRFAATLSAGAGYIWTVPTFTATNLIQRPIYETRVLTYTPVYTGIGSLTFTESALASAIYQINGRSAMQSIYCTGTTGGTANYGIGVTLAISASSAIDFFGNGVINNAAYSNANVYIKFNQTTGKMYIATPTFANFGLGAGRELGGTISYMVA